MVHFVPKGAALDFWVDPVPVRFKEVMFVGPAGTGKSFNVANWIHQLCKEGPENLRVLIVRLTMRSLRQSVQVTFEDKVVAKDKPCWRSILRGQGRETRTRYKYPNGPEVALGGLDDPGKFDSAEFDIIWIEEAKQIPKRSYERLKRCLRNGALGWHAMILTTNPGSDTHWLLDTFPEGVRSAPAGHGDRIHLLSRHEDNPTLEEEYLDRLRSMTGVERANLYEGRWVGESGLVWPQFNPDTHLLNYRVEPDGNGGNRLVDNAARDKGQPIQLKWYAASMDFGYRAPGCFGVWGVDSDRNSYLIAEVYRQGWHLEDWALAIEELYEKFPFQVVVADSAEPRSIDFLNEHLAKRYGRHTGRLVRPADKSKGKKHGLDTVRWALDEGLIRFLVPEERMHHWPDPALKQDGKPTHTTREIPGYIFLDPDTTGSEAQRVVREKSEKPDPRCADHGCDMTEYWGTWAYGDRRLDLSPPEPPKTFAPGTFGAILGTAD